MSGGVERSNSAFRVLVGSAGLPPDTPRIALSRILDRQETLRHANLVIEQGLAEITEAPEQQRSRPKQRPFLFQSLNQVGKVEQVGTNRFRVRWTRSAWIFGHQSPYPAQKIRFVWWDAGSRPGQSR